MMTRHWLRRFAAWLATLLLIMVTADAADADRKSARRRASAEQARQAAALRQRGLEHFVAREYQAAADDLMEAYRLDSREPTLLGWGEAVRALGDCELATRIYRHLLDNTGDLKLARQAEAGMDSCETQPADPSGLSAFLSTRRSSAAADGVLTIEPVPEHDEDAAAGGDAQPGDADLEPVAPAAPSGAATAVVAQRAAASNPHTTSYILMGAGGFAAVGGLATYLSAGGAVTDPDANHGEVTAARSEADWRRLISASVAVVGATVAVVGVLQYRREQRRARGVAVAPYATASSAGVAVSGGF
jgi:hypothetical protein